MNTATQLEKIKNDFFQKIHLRLEANYDVESLCRIYTVDMSNDKLWKYYAIPLRDRQAMTDPVKFNEEVVINQFSDILSEQMFAPTAKTKLGKRIVKAICKYL